LTATNGRWTGTPGIDYGYQWQRCDAKGKACQNLAAATAATYLPGNEDVGSTLRVVVSAGNWIASISQAPSATTGVVAKAPETAADEQPVGRGRPTSGAGSGPGKGPNGSAKTARLTLTKVGMSPKRFALAHRVRQRGTRLDGSRITWRLNKAATVRLVVQRQVGSKRHRRWVTVGTIQRKAAKGAGVVRFTGRFKAKPLAPRAYRLTVTATAGKQKAGPKRIAFRVVSGR
jgi:hypothetical protein